MESGAFNRPPPQDPQWVTLHCGQARQVGEAYHIKELGDMSRECKVEPSPRPPPQHPQSLTRPPWAGEAGRVGFPHKGVR